jgi:hypothetical protein
VSEPVPTSAAVVPDGSSHAGAGFALEGSSRAGAHFDDSSEPRRLERAATWLSLACAVHCLVFPLLGGLLPALGASHLISVDGGLEIVLTLAVVGSVAASGALGFARHRDIRVVLGMVTGLALYLAGHALEGKPVSLGLSIAGALVLASSSFFSARLSQTCDHPGHAH